MALCGLDEPTTVAELESSLAKEPAWWVPGGLIRGSRPSVVAELRSPCRFTAPE